MRRLLALAGMASMALAPPIVAQEAEVTLGFFVRVSAEDVPEFEAAAAAHARWHDDQNDTQSWPVYQALTGPQAEYAFLAGMAWAALDNPSVDMAADIGHWASEVAQHTQSEETMMWVPLPQYGNPPADGTQYPIVQVVEFEIQSGGDAAVMEAIARYKEAYDASGAQVPFSWSRVVSVHGAPRVFVAVWYRTFAELGTPGPTPIEVVASRFGAAQAALLSDGFTAATRQISSRVWTLRPDLSYTPG